MVFKWKENHTPLILGLLEDRQCLWNTKTKDYRNKLTRSNALKEIVNELNFPGLTVEDIKLKIKTIRTRYSSELSKVQQSEKSGTGNNGIYVPKLFWFKQADSFLRAVCVPRTSASTTIIKSKTGNSAINKINKEDNKQQIDVNSKDDIAEKKNEPVGQLYRNETSGSSRNNWKTTKSTTTAARKRCFSEISSVEKIINKISRIAGENKAPENEFDYFCRSLAIQLKNMPLDRALICQEKLQSVMVEERLYQYRMNHLLIPSQQNSSSHAHAELSVSCSPYTLTSYSPSINTSNPTLSPVVQEGSVLSEESSFVESTNIP